MRCDVLPMGASKYLAIGEGGARIPSIYARLFIRDAEYSPKVSPSTSRANKQSMMENPLRRTRAPAPPDGTGYMPHTA